MSLSFYAQVSDFVRETEERMTAVFKHSAQEVIADAQTPVAEGGRMPVDTSFLRNSLVSGINGGGGGGTGPDSYVLAIAGADLGDSIQAFWTANYAVDQEYGSQGRPGRFFMRGAAQKWQAIVAEAARRLEAGA